MASSKTNPTRTKEAQSTMSPDQLNSQSASLPSLQPNALRAAQYVRMTTEHQQYSTNNQSDKILEYARHRNIEIVRTRGSAEAAKTSRSPLPL